MGEKIVKKWLFKYYLSKLLHHFFGTKKLFFNRMELCDYEIEIPIVIFQ